MNLSLTEKFQNSIKNHRIIKKTGKVSNIVGLLIESSGPVCEIGELCHIAVRDSSKPLLAEVVGFKNNKVLLMPIGDMAGLSPDCEVTASGQPLMIGVSDNLIGRIINGVGEPIDGKPAVNAVEIRKIYAQPPDPLTRRRISQPLQLGVSAIDYDFWARSAYGRFFRQRRW